MKRNWYHIPFTLGCLMSIWLCHWNIPSLVCPYLFWTLKSRTRIFIRMGDTTWHLRALVLVDNLIIISSTHIGQPIETHSLSFKEIQHFFWAQRPSVYMWYVHTLTYKHIYINIHIYTEIYVHLNTYKYICTKHTHIHTHIYIHTGTYTCVCAHTESKLEYMWFAYEHKHSLQQLTGRIIGPWKIHSWC